MRVEHVVVQRVGVVVSAVRTTGVGGERGWEFHESAHSRLHSVLQRVGSWAIEAVVGRQAHGVDAGLGVEVDRVLVGAELAITEVPEEFCRIDIRQVHKVDWLVGNDDFGWAVHEGSRCRREHLNGAVLNGLLFLAFVTDHGQRDVVHTWTREHVRWRLLRRHDVVIKVPDVLRSVAGVVFEIHCQRRATAAASREARHGVWRQDGDHLRVGIGTESVVNQQRYVVCAPRIVGVEDRLIRRHFSAVAKAPVLDGTRRSGAQVVDANRGIRVRLDGWTHGEFSGRSRVYFNAYSDGIRATVCTHRDEFNFVGYIFTGCIHKRVGRVRFIRRRRSVVEVPDERGRTFRLVDDVGFHGCAALCNHVKLSVQVRSNLHVNGVG